MEKRILKVLLILLSITTVIFGLGVHAQQNNSTQYVPLEQLPDSSGHLPAATTPIDLTTYLPNIVKLAIGIAGALSVIYIIIGGFKYLSTDAIYEKKEGKEMIINAVWGLFLAISSVVILNTIDPNITKINLNIQPTATTNTAPSTATTTDTTNGSVSTTCVSNGGGTQPCTCNNCVNDPSAFPFKPGVNTTMNANLYGKLQNVGGTLASYSPPVSWYITEAWPTTVGHIDSCHYDGTCVDLNVTPGYQSGTTPSASLIRQLNNMYFALNNGGGLKFVFEVTQSDFDTLVNAGLNKSMPHQIYQTTTAPSFHVSL
jgi:hypothetical protein